MKALHLQLRDHTRLFESRGPEGAAENERKQGSLHEKARRCAPRSAFNAPIQAGEPLREGVKVRYGVLGSVGKSRYHAVTLCSSQIVSSCIK